MARETDAKSNRTFWLALIVIGALAVVVIGAVLTGEDDAPIEETRIDDGPEDVVIEVDPDEGASDTGGTADEN